MAKYVPPHKRNLKVAVEGETVTPPSQTAQRVQNCSSSWESFGSLERKNETKAVKGGRFRFAIHSIFRFCLAGSTSDDHDHHGSIRLQPLSGDSIFLRTKHFTEKPCILVCTCSETKDVNKMMSRGKNPIVTMSDMILSDLKRFQYVRDQEMAFDQYKNGKLSFVARFGTILFHEKPSTGIDTMSSNSDVEAILDPVKRTFNTMIPSSFVESILGSVVLEIGFDSEVEKEYYYVKLVDKQRRNETLSCKCTAGIGGKLEHHKIELNQLRHLVWDIACLENDVDLRFMLATRRILTGVTDSEKHDITNLIESAVIDRTVLGNLRWPLGIKYCGDRYSVIATAYTKSKYFKNSLMSMKLSDYDRYDYWTLKRDVTRQVSLKMTGIAEHIRGKNFEPGPLTEMLQEHLKLIWDHFLSCV
ncbi:hypothetical protein MKW98_028150 [Papaver atlanticum]|uniref:DUF7903 domain-containing protein n=1 Tax=Papaver atlanticum TaxID=357466 RepID=A0AAD4SYX7_9MAGN|nr:hypothetical protein MKW98_028150 [Papaver atlanticum]